MARIRVTKLLSILIILITAMFLLGQSTTLTSTASIVQRILDTIFDLKRDADSEYSDGPSQAPMIPEEHFPKRDADFQYFYGPSRVPMIPEKHFSKPKFDNKYIIYDCITDPCGGLGDRQAGIVAAYVIAQMMKRRFGVKITIPCDVKNVLMENKSPWIVNESSLQGPSVSAFQLFDDHARRLRSAVHLMDLEKIFSSDVVLFNVNQEFVQYLMKMSRFSDLKWAQNRSVADIYNIVLRRLFKLNPFYQNKFDRFQESVRAEGRQLACAHIRLHDYKHDNYHVDPNVSEYVNTIWSLLKKYNSTKTYRIFVATNAELVRREAKQMFPEVIVDVDGPIIHVDEDTQGPSCEEGMAKTHIDQLILSTCDILIMSDSGFSRVGAMLRGTDDNLYNLAGKASYADMDFIPSYW